MEYTLKTLNDLKDLVHLEETSYNDLSPFITHQPSRDKPALHTEYGEKGTIDPILKKALKTLKKPDSFIDLNYISKGSQLSYSLFNANDQLISLHYSDEDITLNTPADYHDVFEGLQSFTGYSTVKSLDLTLRLSLDQIIVLFSGIDLQRRKTLIAYGSNVPPEKFIFTQSDLVNYLERKDFSPNDFLYYFQNFGLDEIDISRIISELVNETLLEPNNKAFQLSEKMFYLAAHCLLNESFIHLKNVLNHQGEGTLLETFVLQYGLGEVIKFSLNKNQLLVESLSSFGLYAWMTSLIENQSLLLEKTSKKPAAEKKGGYCSNCGFYYETLPNFCGKCGEKIK